LSVRSLVISACAMRIRVLRHLSLIGLDWQEFGDDGGIVDLDSPLFV